MTVLEVGVCGLRVAQILKERKCGGAESLFHGDGFPMLFCLLKRISTPLAQRPLSLQLPLPSVPEIPYIRGCQECLRKIRGSTLLHLFHLLFCCPAACKWSCLQEEPLLKLGPDRGGERKKPAETLWASNGCGVIESQTTPRWKGLTGNIESNSQLHIEPTNVQKILELQQLGAVITALVSLFHAQPPC